jgi:hypothetical protein
MRFLIYALGLALASCTQSATLETRDRPPTDPGVPNTEGLTLGYSIVKTLHDPQWLRDPAILGRCSASLDPASNLEIPCQNVVVTAIDEKGMERGRASVETGKFRLSVEKGKDYYVRVIAPLYKVDARNRLGPLHAGETIDLRLSRK